MYIPAMLSSSGRAEKLVEDLDAGFSITSRDDEFSVDYLNCRVGGVSLSAHGTINAGTVVRGGAGEPSLPLAEFVSKNYVTLSRELAHAGEGLAALDQGAVTAVLTPSDTRGAVVNAELFASSLRLPAPLSLDAETIRASARFPLLGGASMASAVGSIESLQVGLGSASGVRARVRGLLNLETNTFSPKQLRSAPGPSRPRGSACFPPWPASSPGRTSG